MEKGGGDLRETDSRGVGAAGGGFDAVKGWLVQLRRHHHTKGSDLTQLFLGNSWIERVRAECRASELLFTCSQQLEDVSVSSSLDNIWIYLGCISCY